MYNKLSVFTKRRLAYIGVTSLFIFATSCGETEKKLKEVESKLETCEKALMSKGQTFKGFKECLNALEGGYYRQSDRGPGRSSWYC